MEGKGENYKPVTVVFATDFHLWHIPPVNRIDNYFDAGLRKLSDVLTSASRREADIVILGGDLFHRASARLPEVNVVASLLEAFMKGSGIPILVCVGEHDLYGRSVSSYLSGPLGVLSFTSAVIAADGNQPGFLYTTSISKGGGSGIGVACLPCPETRSGEGLTKSLNALWDMCEHSSNPPRIICLHHSISVNSVPWDYIHPGDIGWWPQNSLVLCGDTHMGPDIFEDDTSSSKIVIPGAAVRRTIDEKDRKPHFVVAKVGETDVSVELVPFDIGIESPFVEVGKGKFLSSLFKKKPASDGSEKDEIRPPGRRLSATDIYMSKVAGSPRGLINRGLEIIESILEEDEEDEEI